MLSSLQSITLERTTADTMSFHQKKMEKEGEEEEQKRDLNISKPKMSLWFRELWWYQPYVAFEAWRLRGRNSRSTVLSKQIIKGDSLDGEDKCDLHSMATFDRDSP